MTQLVTESIWHFAGYLHLCELLNDTPVHYTGAPTYKFASYTPDQIPSGEIDLWRTPSQGSKSVQFNVDARSPTTAHHELERPIPQVLPIPKRVDLLVEPAEPEDRLVPKDGAGHFSFAPGGGEFEVKISLTYDVGPTRFTEFSIEQLNVMFDLDALLGFSDHQGAGTSFTKDPTLIVNRIIHSAEKLIPEGAIADLRPDGSDISLDGQADHINPFPIDLSGARRADALSVDETSHYVNGVRLDDPDEPIDASDAIISQGAAIQAAVQEFNAKFEDKDAAGEDAEVSLPSPTDAEDDTGEVAEGEHVHVVTDTTPTGGYAQESTTGANSALNVAVIDDRADGIASLVIEGDLHETNAIIQVNVLADKDFARASGQDVARSIVDHNNSLKNEATFIADPGVVFGDGVTGFSGALNWHITYVTGDYWNIATLSQTNVLVDGDLSQQTTASAHYTAVLGANGQLNFVELSEGSLDYDLIIVGGNYYDYNTILQLNLVYDADVIKQLLSGEGSQTVEAGGNALTNDASIVGIGSEDFKPMTADVQFLVDAVAEQQPFLFPAQALGLPGNGTDRLDVLYVSGDYFDLDLIYQTNVIADGDKIEQSALTGEGADELAQAITAGANDATNVALIIDVDSLSGYQYLGGEVYEDTMLVQANIVVGEDEEDALDASSLHPDVVAAVAAMSDDATEHSNTPSAEGDHVTDGMGTDLLGGVMA